MKWMNANFLTKITKFFFYSVQKYKINVFFRLTDSKLGHKCDGDSASPNYGVDSFVNFVLDFETIFFFLIIIVQKKSAVKKK